MESVFQQLAAADIQVLFLLDQRYLNPLIATQQAKLREAGLLEDADNRVALEKLNQAMLDLPPATYFPTPIAREMKEGTPFSLTLAEKYSYGYIQVDIEQNWSMQGIRLDQRLKKFLQSHLAYEEELRRYFVEYQVEKRMDKCYLDCEITPMLARHIEIQESDPLLALLNNGKHDYLDPRSFSMDAQENLYCRSSCHGEVLLADYPRYRILKHVTEDGNYLHLNHSVFPLSFRSSVEDG